MAWLLKPRRLNPRTGRVQVYYSIGWRTGGKAKTRALGFISPTDAERARKILEGRQAAGQPVEPETSERSCLATKTTTLPTLGEYLFDVYILVVEREKRPATAASERYACKALRRLLGHRRLDHIDYAAVDGYLSKRADEGRMPRTRYIELRTLRYALRHACDCKLINEVPRLPRVKMNERKPHRFLDDADAVALLDASRPLDRQPHKVTKGKPPQRRDRLSYLAILTALNSGMRKGEILTREWGDVRWDWGPNGSIFVGPKPQVDFQVKMRRSRLVPMTPELRSEMEKAYGEIGSPEAGWIFPSPVDNSLPRKTFITALAGACRRAGIQKVSHHDLRHTWASRLAMAGVDRRTLMEVGGWKESRVLDEIYSHVTDDHVAEVMSRMGIGTKEETERSKAEEVADRGEVLDKNARQFRVLEGGKQGDSPNDEPPEQASGGPSNDKNIGQYEAGRGERI